MAYDVADELVGEKLGHVTQAVELPALQRGPEKRTGQQWRRVVARELGFDAIVDHTLSPSSPELLGVPIRRMPPLRRCANSGSNITCLASGAAPGNELSFETLESETETVVTVGGEVDMATAPQLDHYLCALVDRDVVVDLSGVVFLDSSGVSALVNVLQAFEARGRTLRVVGERDNVRTVFEVTGVYDALHRDA